MTSSRALDALRQAETLSQSARGHTSAVRGSTAPQKVIISIGDRLVGIVRTVSLAGARVKLYKAVCGDKVVDIDGEQYGWIHCTVSEGVKFGGREIQVKVLGQRCVAGMDNLEWVLELLSEPVTAAPLVPPPGQPVRRGEVLGKEAAPPTEKPDRPKSVPLPEQYVTITGQHKLATNKGRQSIGWRVSCRGGGDGFLPSVLRLDSERFSIGDQLHALEVGEVEVFGQKTRIFASKGMGAVMAGLPRTKQLPTPLSGSAKSILERIPRPQPFDAQALMLKMVQTYLAELK